MVFTRAIILFSVFVVWSGAALPTHYKREVPQEHSHESIVRACDRALKISNPDNIRDAVFGLLDTQGAAGGKGSVSDPDCLQAAVADRAFTNAKAGNDVAGMTAALQYRTLERNTNAVGVRSPACTSFTPVNKEIAALSQHQDAASDGASARNKAVVIELAKQIASVGGNPQDALNTGTFAAGQVSDATAKGNTCNDTDDNVGCIFTQGKLVLDATSDEINAAVGASPSSAPASTITSSVPLPTPADSDCIAIPVVITITGTATPTAGIAARATPAPIVGVDGGSVSQFGLDLGVVPPAFAIHRKQSMNETAIARAAGLARNQSWSGEVA